MDRIENDAYNNSSIACVSVAAGTCLPSHGLAAIGEIHIHTGLHHSGFQEFGGGDTLTDSKVIS
jgi:hypothetical protein